MSSLIFSESFIEDMLNMAQINSNVFAMDSHIFELQPVFDFIMNIFKPLCAAKNIDLTFKIVNSIKPQVVLGQDSA